MTRSLSTKAFEHWCATHLTYRYGPNARLWWPTDGDDPKPPRAAGERFWMEFVGTQWSAKRKAHTLSVDLEQLRRYGKQDVPDYYAFPAPPWEGVLGKPASATWLGDLHVSDLGRAAPSGAQWFARWTRVVSGDRLRRAVAKAGKGKDAIAVAHIAAGELTPAKGVKSLKDRSWHEFWADMDGAELPAGTDAAAGTKGFVWKKSTSRALVTLEPR